MTAYEMNQKALALMGVDTTDVSLLSEYNTALLIGYNAAYRDIVANNLDTQIWESEALSADKTFLISALSNAVSDIIAIAQYQDYTAAAGYQKAQRYAFEVYNGTTVIVPDADTSSTIYVLYRPIPAELVNPNPTTGTNATSPLYISAQHQIALVYKGISELRFSQSDTESGVIWQRRYMDAIQNIKPLSRQTTVTSNYSY
jgi:hypothetical protein